MPGGLLVYDADGYVIDVNSSAAAIFGLPAEGNGG